jgi:hypothetical protein
MRRASLVVFAAALAGCALGAGTRTPSLPQVAGDITSPPHSGSNTKAEPSVVLSFTLPHVKRRQPRYVSPSSFSVSISVNGAAPTVVDLDTAGGPCQPITPGGPLTCSVDIAAPVGSDTFAVTFRDKNGAILSTGSARADIAADVVNNVSIVFNGVIASLFIGFATPAPVLHVAGKFPLFVTARDADENPIVCSAPCSVPQPYAKPIHIADSDTSSATLLSRNGLIGARSVDLLSPTDTVAVVYDGGTIAGGVATITATVSGTSVPAARATFQPAAGAAEPAKLIYVTEPNTQAASSQIAIFSFSGSAYSQAAILGGNATGITAPASVALDASGNIFVANNFDLTDTPSITSSVEIFAANSTANAAPMRTIAGAATGMTSPVAPIDVAVGTGDVAYVSTVNESNFSNAQLNVFANTATNSAPTSTLSLPGPAFALGPDGRIYGESSSQQTGGSIAVYAANSTGNAAPTRTIAGSNTELVDVDGLTIDAQSNIYVSNSGGVPAILVFSRSATGNATPIHSLSGALTDLVEPDGIAVDANGFIYVGDIGEGEVLVFRPGTWGNVAPAYTIPALDPYGVAIRNP